MHGISTGDSYPYDIELAIMREMHWSWSQLQEAPFDMLNVILAEISARNKWQRKKQEWDEEMAKAK